MTLCVGGALLFGAPRSLHAQAEQQLNQAIARYENLETARARTLFEQVVSPTTPFPVSESQRVVAYKYLGALQVAAGKPDSARIYFQAAIGRDPLVDLDPRSFSEQERQAFQRAKQSLFRVGLKPLRNDTLDPARDKAGLISFATTHSGRVTVVLHNTTDDRTYQLFDGIVEGPRDITFSGRNPNGIGFIPPGVYDVRVGGASELLNSSDRFDSTSALVEIGWLREPLEDTIQAFGAGDTLPAQVAPSAAARDFGLGAVIAAGAILASKVVGSSDLQGSSAMSSSVAGLGIVTGLYAYMHRRSHPEIPANVAENAARRERRDQRNGAIMARNNDRIAATRLTVRPLGQ